MTYDEYLLEYNRIMVEREADELWWREWWIGKRLERLTMKPGNIPQPPRVLYYHPNNVSPQPQGDL